jgi:hypothetical protein
MGEEKHWRIVVPIGLKIITTTPKLREQGEKKPSALGTLSD